MRLSRADEQAAEVAFIGFLGLPSSVCYSVENFSPLQV